MSEFYNQSLRVRGGTGFADAIFRVNASPGEYSKRLGKNLFERLGVKEYFDLFNTDTFFLITKDDKPIIVKSYHFVELKRQEGVHAFEEWLEKEIKDLMC